MSEKNLPKEEEIQDEDLPDRLLQFYCDLRKTDGDTYKINSLKSIRAGLNRHFKATRGIDIVTDVRFHKANEMFDGVKVEVKKQGKGVTVSKKPISSQDMKTISSYFTYSHQMKPDPKMLQEFVSFNTLYYFCRRGHENLYTMTKGHFKIQTDSETNQKYVIQSIDKLDKNHRADDQNATNEGRMYEMKGKFDITGRSNHLKCQIHQ